MGLAGLFRRTNGPANKHFQRFKGRCQTVLELPQHFEGSGVQKILVLSHYRRISGEDEINVGALANF